MTTSVSGPLRLVTDQPAMLVQVMVRAPKPRPHAGGMVVDFATLASVEGGVVSFPCVPGPAVLLVVHAKVPQVTVPLVVPDKASATLEECIRAAELADTATRSELEDLAARAVAAVSQAESSAAAAQESAGAAEADRREVASDREAVEGYHAQVVSLHGEAVDARGVAEAAAETATLKAEETTNLAWSVHDSALWARDDADRAEAAAAAAKADADRATSEADRAGQAAEASSVKAVSDRVNELLSGAPEAYDTLLEIAEELERGQSAEAALVKEISGKAPLGHTHTAEDVGAAPADHTHAVADVTGLQSALDGKVASSDVSENLAGGSIPRRTLRGAITSSPPTLPSEVATKHYVDDRTPKVQVVTDLPESPTSGVVYLVTE